MAIANIKSNLLRRTIIIVGMPVFILIAASYGASVYVFELFEDAVSAWKRSQL